jgi:hypothetical protein
MSHGEYRSAERDAARQPPSDDDGYALDEEPVSPEPESEGDLRLPPINEHWDTFWPLERRVKVAAVMLVLNVVLLPLSDLLIQSLLTIVTTLLINSLLQIFVLGTFDRLDVKRSPVGKIVVARTWRICFYPLPTQRIRWRELATVSCRASHEHHSEDWLGVIALLPYCIIPSFLWYWYVIRPDQFIVALCKDHGYAHTILFRSWNQEQAQEVARTVAEVTGMRISC